MLKLLPKNSLDTKLYFSREKKMKFLYVNFGVLVGKLNNKRLKIKN